MFRSPGTERNVCQEWILDCNPSLTCIGTHIYILMGYIFDYCIICFFHSLLNSSYFLLKSVFSFLGSFFFLEATNSLISFADNFVKSTPPLLDVGGGLDTGSCLGAT